jgi:hypothetical protein
MKITRAKLKETLRTIVNEESEYQSFFKAALEKAGKSIPSMSDEEKKEFFNKIDAAWDAKGEKNEALVGGQKELDVDGDGDIEADDLADLRAGKKADESVTEGKKVFKVNPGIGKAKYSISSHDGVKKHKDGSDFFDIEIFKNKVDLEKGIKNYTSKGFVKESVNEAKFKVLASFGGYDLIEAPTEKDMIVSKNGKKVGKLTKISKYLKDDIKSFINMVKSGKLGESVNESTINESPSSEEIRIAMLAVSKQKKYRRVTSSAAVNDLMNSLEVIARDIKNGKIKDESVNESSKDDDYADELQKETEKVLKGKNIKGWKLYVDSRSGTFEFEKKGIDLLIYATPMWDGNPNLPFNVMDGEGDNVNMIEKLIGNKLPFKPSYDLKKDISNYISVLTKILPKVEQAYGKLKKESVNEAPEGKKRFMFDFYSDSNQRSTEREVNFIAPNLEAAISEAESMCKKLKLGYVEIYYKDLFLGSMKQQNGFKFVEGRGYSKFKSTN